MSIMSQVRREHRKQNAPAPRAVWFWAYDTTDGEELRESARYGESQRSTISHIFATYAAALTDMLRDISTEVAAFNLDIRDEENPPLKPPHRNEIKSCKYHDETLDATWTLHKRELRT